jgi:hypothetical protein
MFQTDNSIGPKTIKTSPQPQDSMMSTSAESNKAVTGTSTKGKVVLVRSEEAKFLEYYGVEQYYDLTNAEYKS